MTLTTKLALASLLAGISLPVIAQDVTGTVSSAVDTTVSGEMTPKGSTVGVPVSMHLMRAAGSEDGTFSITPGDDRCMHVHKPFIIKKFVNRICQ